MYRRDDGRRSEIQSWCQDRNGCCWTRRQPLEALMKGAWTHGHIMAAWYWRAQSCYYSFVMLTPRRLFMRGRPSQTFVAASRGSNLLTRAFHKTTNFHPASLILRTIAYPIKYQPADSLFLGPYILISCTFHLLLTCNCRDTVPGIHLALAHSTALPSMPDGLSDTVTCLVFCSKYINHAIRYCSTRLYYFEIIISQPTKHVLDYSHRTQMDPW